MLTVLPVFEFSSPLSEFLGYPCSVHLCMPRFSRVFPRFCIVSFSLTAFVFSGAYSSRCRSCQQPVPDWDRHDLCVFCRSCNKEARCTVCRTWSAEWAWLASKKKSGRNKRPGNVLASVGECSGPQDSGQSPRALSNSPASSGRRGGTSGRRGRRSSRAPVATPTSTLTSSTTSSSPNATLVSSVVTTPPSSTTDSTFSVSSLPSVVPTNPSVNSQGVTQPVTLVSSVLTPAATSLELVNPQGAQGAVAGSFVTSSIIPGTMSGMLCARSDPVLEDQGAPLLSGDIQTSMLSGLLLSANANTSIQSGVVYPVFPAGMPNVSQPISVMSNPGVALNLVSCLPSTVPHSRAEVSTASGLPSGNPAVSTSLREILLSSDSTSHRDFEGFQPEQGPSQEPGPSRRSRSRSRKDHGGHRRRRRRGSSSRSSSASSASPSPRRSKRSRRDTEPDQTSQLLSQLVGLLSNLPNLLPPQSAPQGVSSASPNQAPAAEPTFSEVSVSDSERPLPHPGEITPSDRPAYSDEEPESDGDDKPLCGTDIPLEVFDKAVGILRRCLGFPLEPEAPDPSAGSRLTLNKPSSSKATLPVDVECVDRFKAMSASFGHKWFAYSKAQNTAFRVEDKQWRDLFKTPAVPRGAEEYMRSVGTASSSGRLKSTAPRRNFRSLQQIDTAARVGLKYSSSLLLIAEVLSRSLGQTLGEISRKDSATLVSLLGPLSRRIYDQFARVSSKSVADRRELILDAMRLSQEGIRRRFQELPTLGEDIFAGQFDTLLQAEAKKKKELQEANLTSRSTSKRSPSRRSSRPSRGNRGARQTFFQASSRASFQSGRSRQSTSGYPSRSRARGSSRGTSSSRGRGFSRP